MIFKVQWCCAQVLLRKIQLRSLDFAIHDKSKFEIWLQVERKKGYLKKGNLRKDFQAAAFSKNNTLQDFRGGKTTVLSISMFSVSFSW